METNKTNRLDDQILRSKRIEFMMKNLDYSKDVLVETKNSLLDFGHYILGELSDEFNNKTDNAVKFENDFNVAVSNHQEITRSYFKDSETERLTDINNLIIKCFGNKRVYRMLNQYISMCSYLEFLQQPEQGDVTGKNDFDTNDFTEPSPEKFSHLPLSGLPIINDGIVKPKFIIEKYYNKAFECSLDAFYAWLVYGRVYDEPIKWTYRKSPKSPISKAQLKLFINAITGDEENTKDLFFDTIFGMKVKKSDYKNSHTLDMYFNDLIEEISKNKLPK